MPHPTPQDEGEPGITHEPIGDEDLAQEIALARLIALRDGTDPESAAREAEAAYHRQVKEEESMRAASGVIDLDWLPEANAVARHRIDPPAGREDGKQLPHPDRPYRDVAMFICYVAGMRTRDIARAFGIHQAHVSKAVARMRGLTGITRQRDRAVRLASSKSPKGRMVRIGDTRTRAWVNRYDDSPPTNG